MVADGEPAFQRPPRLCIGESRATGKPIYAEGFGEWRCEDYPIFDQDSDDSASDGFEVGLHHTVLFWWEWYLEEVLAEELQMAEEDEFWQAEALRQQSDEEEHLRHLLASNGLDGEGAQGS